MALDHRAPSMSEEVRRVEVEVERVSFEVVRFEGREIARLLDRQEVARLLHVSDDTVDREVADRALAITRVRGQPRFIVADVLDYIARNRRYGA